MIEKGKKCIWAVIALFLCGVLVGVIASSFRSPLKRNEQVLTKNILSLHDTAHESTVRLSELTPFEWDQVVAFKPYTSKEDMEKILGFTSPALKEGINEGMNTIVFSMDDKVVCCICDFPSELGYVLDLGMLDSPNQKFMRIYPEIDTLIVLQDMNLVHLELQGEFFEGTILEIAGNSGLIQIDDGFSIRLSGDQAWIYLDDEVKQEAVVGKRVKVRYDGVIQETYPMQIPGLLAVELLEEASLTTPESFVSDQSTPSEERQTAKELPEVLPRFYKKDGKQYETVPDLLDGQYHWASVVSEGKVILDSHGHEHIDYNSQIRWFEALEEGQRIEVRRWDNLRYSAGDYLIYEYDGTIHVAKPDKIHYPVLSYDGEGTHGNVFKVPEGYMVANEKNYTVTFYDETFQVIREIDGYRAGESGLYYCDGMMAVRDMNTGYCGFMDSYGELVIPCKYGQVSDFVNGKASVLVDAELIPYTEDGGRVQMYEAIGGHWETVDLTGSLIVES